MAEESTALVQAKQQLKAKKAELLQLDRDAATGVAIAPQMLHLLEQWSERYGLDPYAGHTIFYRGKPFVTEVGAIAYAVKKLGRRYQGFSCEPLHEEDLRALGYNAVNGDCGWKCSVYIADYKVPIVDYGIITNEEIQEAITKAGDKAKHLPLVKSPMLLAKARAIRRALKIASPLDMNGLMDEDMRVVDATTGEITETPPSAPTALTAGLEPAKVVEVGRQHISVEGPPAIRDEDFLAMSEVEQARLLLQHVDALKRRAGGIARFAELRDELGVTKTAVELAPEDRLRVLKAVIAASAP